MGDENIFDELEAFLDEAAPPPVAIQKDSSSVTTAMANPSTPGQTSNMNQYSPAGQGGAGCIRGASGGSVSTTMMPNGYQSAGCSLQTKKVLGERIDERLRNQLSGRGENPSSGDLKRKMDDGLGGSHDGTFNKAPKLEIKDEPNMFMKSEIKEENSNSQLEAILGMNSSSSEMKPKSELNMNGGNMDVKQDFSQMSNKPAPHSGGILAKALMETRRDSGSNNNMTMFNNNTGGNMRTMNPSGFNGGRNIPDSASMRSQMDPQSLKADELKALKNLQELSKDKTLDPSTRHKRALEIMNETPGVRQVLEWNLRRNGKGNHQRSMGNMPSNDMLGPLQSSGCPQTGGMMGNNCDPQVKTGSPYTNSDPSMNGGGNIGGVHEFSPVPTGGIQPGSPMNFNGSMSGPMMSQDMETQRMWEMNKQQIGGVNQRSQHSGAPNVMVQNSPQGGSVPSSQFVHGSTIGARSMGPTNGVNGYGTPPGMNNNPNMYQQAPNMIVGNNPGQNWSMIRQPGMNKPSTIPPPYYNNRAPVNVRMERSNIRPGLSPAMGGYLSHSSGQSNAFNGNCGPTGPVPRGSFPVGPSMGDQYPVRNPNFPNTMYGGPNSNQNMDNGMPQMSVRMNVGYPNNPHGDVMHYQNGGHAGQTLGENNYLNPMQVGRNGPTQGMGSPMGNPNEYQRGMMHPNNPNLVRPPTHHMSPVAGGRIAIPHTSPMVQQHLVSQGNMNGLPQNINPGSPAQRMMQVNGPNNGGVFQANNGLPPPNMTVPDADIQRFGHGAPPNYFNNDNVGEGASGNNTANSFNSIHQSGSHQMHQPQHRSQSNQQSGGQVQSSYTAVGANSDGNYPPFNNQKSLGPCQGNNGHSMGNSADNSGDPNHQQASNGWKQNATELRKTLLTRLHQALLKQGNPSAQQVAESVEQSAFMQSGTQEAYTMKLAQWLADMFSKQSDGTEGNNSSKIEENPSQQNTDNQHSYFDKEKEVNNMVNPQQNQQTMNMNQSSNVPKNDSPSMTSATSADSTTLKEALSKNGATTLPNLENNNDSISGKTEVDLFSSSNLNESINHDVSSESGINNMGTSSLSKTNPLLEDLIQGESEIASFDNTGSSNMTKLAENDGSELLEDPFNKAPNMMMGQNQENDPSVSTPNAAPLSNSSIYNMPSMSPNSSNSSATPCSTSTTTITTAPSSQDSSCKDMRNPTSSIPVNPTSSSASSKSCDSPIMTFSGNSIKMDENSPVAIEHLNASNTSSSSQGFQPPANFPVSTLESNETGNKGAQPNSGQGPAVSSAVTISANNTCITTVANKGSAMVTPVRRPSGKGISGQQSIGQPGPLTNHGNSTVLSSLPGSINGQLPNGNGQNNIQPHSVDSGIGSPRSIASSTLYSPKIQGTSPSLNPISETLTSSASPPDKGSS